MPKPEIVVTFFPRQQRRAVLHPLRLFAFFFSVAVALGLAAINAEAQAALPLADEGYTIELIVYEDLRDQALEAEYWAIDPGAPSATEAIRLSEPVSAQDPDDAASATAAAAPIRALASEELRLTEAWQTLRRSKNYRPLLHRGWRQPDWRRSQMQPVYLTTYPEQPPNTPANAELPALVEGIVAVYLQNYLHLAIDVIYRRAAPSGEPADAVLHIPPKHYRLQALRRIRFDQLHYIDHPLFGILLRITEPESES